MKKIFILICLLLQFNYVSHAAISNTDSEYQIQFGVFEKDESGEVKLNSTLEIPLYYKETGFRWGFIVTKKDGGVFTGYEVYHLPESPEAITGALEKAKTSDEGRQIQDIKKRFIGMWVNENYFDPGDPPGKYRLEIFIDDKLLKEIEFFVIKE